ncbi:MPN527 family putative ECF transporter permease subunit [Mycoplasma buteonis]|uniref:MPN527 family putative ECF transporter permease subunit n=1 Tax=Mycoplasma buteonis TaxID=171280 RepID=UPI0005600856|nr:hypothetical protein [Mycoplasma buteonis]
MEQNKKLSSYWIVLTALLLALSMIIEAGSSFLKFSFLSFNLSLVIVLFFFYLAGYKYVLFLIFLKTILMILFKQSGFILLTILGNVLVLIAQLLFVFFFYLASLGFKKMLTVNARKSLTKNRILSEALKWNFALFVAMLITSLFLALLNTFFTNSIYFKILNLFPELTFNLTKVQEFYESKNLSSLFFGIKSYFWASFSFYLVFNLSNFIFNIVVTNLVMLFEFKTMFFKNSSIRISLHKY